MLTDAPRRDLFILSAFDRDQWCPVLQARFYVDNLEDLRSILGEEANEDTDLRQRYRLDEGDLLALDARFAVAFDATKIQFENPDVFLCRQHSIDAAPYLIHTGYELPLLLDGRKKLARMGEEYPPDTFEGEERFNHWVAAGVLSRMVIHEPFPKPVKGWLGHRSVYYTPVGEEWRVPAMRMLSQASGRSGGWNAYFERLEGMLFGYSDKENDWWINVGVQGGGFGGVALCGAVDADGLAWLEDAGFRALPPTKGPVMKLAAYRPETEASLRDVLFENPDTVALVRFNILWRHIMNVGDFTETGPWDVPRDQIPLLNRHIRGLVTVIACHRSSAAQQDCGASFGEHTANLAEFDRVMARDGGEALLSDDTLRDA